jgi:hypothetical protein
MAAYPAAVTVTIAFQMMVSKDQNDRYPIVVLAYRARQKPGFATGLEEVERLPIRLDEVYPEEGTAFRMRIQAWTERFSRDALMWLGGNRKG